MMPVLGEPIKRICQDQLHSNSTHSIVEITHGNVYDNDNDIIDVLGQRRDSPTSIAKPVRPTEFSLWVAFPFVTLFVMLAIALGIIYAKARINGMSLALCASNICRVE
jgi:hypothetical protein